MIRLWPPRWNQPGLSQIYTCTISLYHLGVIGIKPRMTWEELMFSQHFFLSRYFNPQPRDVFCPPKILKKAENTPLVGITIVLLMMIRVQFIVLHSPPPKLNGLDAFSQRDNPWSPACPRPRPIAGWSQHSCNDDHCQNGDHYTYIILYIISMHHLNVDCSQYGICIRSTFKVISTALTFTRSKHPNQV